MYTYIYIYMYIYVQVHNIHCQTAQGLRWSRAGETPKDQVVTKEGSEEPQHQVTKGERLAHENFMGK